MGHAAHSQPVQEGWPCHYYNFDVEVPVRCPPDLLPYRLRTGGRIKVRPVMFTTGINANSTLSNLTKGAAKQGSLQHSINDRSWSDLRNIYHEQHRAWLTGIGDSAALDRLQQLEVRNVYFTLIK